MLRGCIKNDARHKIPSTPVTTNESRHSPPTAPVDRSPSAPGRSGHRLFQIHLFEDFLKTAPHGTGLVGIRADPSIERQIKHVLSSRRNECAYLPCESAPSPPFPREIVEPA